MSVKRCNTKERANLLKKMILNMASIVAAFERSYRRMAWGSSGLALTYFMTYSTMWPLAVRTP